MRRRDVAALLKLLDVAHRENVGSDDLQLRRGYRAGVAVAAPSDMPGRGDGLVETWSDEAVDVTLEFRALTDGVDVGVAGLQRRADLDAAPDRESDVAGKLHVRPDRRCR